MQRLTAAILVPAGIAVCLFVPLFAVPVRAQSASDCEQSSTWELVYPPPWTTRRDVTWDGRRFVAVGDRGIVMNSVDATEWTFRDSRTRVNLRGVACRQEVCVAVGPCGTVTAAHDTRDWHARHLKRSWNFLAIAASTERFVAVGRWGATATSRDGVSWHVTHSGQVEDLVSVVNPQGTLLIPRGHC